MAEAHANARLEAFCDGVFAIALTLLIIDVKLPATESIASTAEVWRALRHLAPSIFAFLLSFGVILIVWVNHHAMLKLVSSSSTSFIYANGFLLLLAGAWRSHETRLSGVVTRPPKRERHRHWAASHRRRSIDAELVVSHWSQACSEDPLDSQTQERQLPPLLVEAESENR